MKKDTNKDSKSNKPAPKKLSLDKETLRSLTTDELDQVQGGITFGCQTLDTSTPWC
jgi:hypothetical protein